MGNKCSWNAGINEIVLTIKSHLSLVTRIYSQTNSSFVGSHALLTLERPTYASFSNTDAFLVIRHQLFAVGGNVKDADNPNSK